MKRYIAALCFCLAMLIMQGAANPAPIRIGHGLIGNLNPHETGAIVLGSYFDPNQGTYNNYWSSEYRIFDLWRFMPSRFFYVNKFNNINYGNWNEWYRYGEYIRANISPKPLYILQDTYSS
ncbi:MAG: hypothetical protein QG575_1164 [Euryarchaeota archaeon]|nr:hypothetical protein [Euryarchaeota archaeon]